MRKFCELLSKHTRFASVLMYVFLRGSSLCTHVCVCLDARSLRVITLVCPHSLPSHVFAVQPISNVSALA